MPKPRGILFALKEDLPNLKSLIPSHKFSLYEKVWQKPGDIPLSGAENDTFTELIRDVGAWAIFLPHPESTPPRRRITRAVLRALNRNSPRPLRFIFYDLTNKSTISYDWDGSSEEFFSLLPLVSVIVRTDGSPLLREALQSLREQTYDRFEVIVVEHGQGFKPSSEDWRDFELQVIKGKEDRGRNLNLGVEAAGGRYLAFLDQDDLWRPQHLESLVTALQSQPLYALAYSGTCLSQWEKTPSGSVFKKVLRFFREDFDPLRLFFENYIPLNSLLLRREIFLFEKFPENVSAYEDWIFLVKLALKGLSFLTLKEITAEYRIFSKDLLQSHKEKGFLEAEPRAVELILENLTSKGYFILKKAFLKARTQTKNFLVPSSVSPEESFPLSENKKQISPTLRKDLLISPSSEGSQEGFLSSSWAISEDKNCGIVVAARDTPEDLLERLFESIRANEGSYTIYLLENGGSTNSVERVVRKLRKKLSNRLSFWRRWGESISKGYNYLIEKCSEPYVLIVDHDDEIAPHAIKKLLKPLQKRKKHLVYADSEIIDRAGRPILRQQKPDWSPATLFSFNYINHPLVITKSLWQELGGFREEYDGAQDWDFILRAAERLSEKEVQRVPEVLYGWRAHPGSLALHPREKPWVFSAAYCALEDAIKRRLSPNKELICHLRPNPEGAGFLKEWEPTLESPSVRAIILTPGNLFRVKQLLKHLEGSYPHLSFTVVSNGKIPLTPEELGGEVINLCEKSFNWSKFNNLAAQKVCEDFLLFLNDDLVPEPGFVASLIGTAVLTEAGAVGAALFFPDGSLQHNGIRTHVDGIAQEIRTQGACGELAVTRNVSAVTGAALLVPRKLFEVLHGFNEDLPYNFNDVEFCLRLRQKDYPVVLAWEAQAVHFHMTSRGKTSVHPKEKEILVSYGKLLKEKFFYRWEKF